jgi:hypothetical protein
VGQRGAGPVAVAGFIAAQRAEHPIPQATACRALGSARRGSLRGATATPRHGGLAGNSSPWRSGGCSPRTAAATAPRGSPPICARRAGRSARTPSRRSWPSSGWSPAASAPAGVAPGPGGGGGGPRTRSGVALPPGRSTASGTATAPRSSPPRANCAWTACWTWPRAGWSASRWASITTPSWPTRRWPWRSRCAAGGTDRWGHPAHRQ